MLGIPGLIEVFVILLVILVLLGSRLPEACRSIGRSIMAFREGLRGQEEAPRKDDEPRR